MRRSSDWGKANENLQMKEVMLLIFPRIIRKGPALAQEPTYAASAVRHRTVKGDPKCPAPSIAFGFWRLQVVRLALPLGPCSYVFSEAAQPSLALAKCCAALSSGLTFFGWLSLTGWKYLLLVMTMASIYQTRFHCQV